MEGEEGGVGDGGTHERTEREPFLISNFFSFFSSSLFLLGVALHIGDVWSMKTSRGSRLHETNAMLTLR